MSSAEDWDDPEAPADWYLDEEAGALRWWDGYGWTDRYQAGPGRDLRTEADWHGRKVTHGRH